MKKTIFASHSIPWVLPRWVKVSSFFVVFLLLGFGSANAQYKSATAVMNIIDQEIEELQSNGVQVHTSSTITLDQKVVSFKVKYYTYFKQLVKENQSVATAVEQLDSRFQADNLPQNRAILVTTARNDLIELISE